MKKIYHLSTCDTCRRILNELNPSSDFILQDIKNEAITTEQIEEMYELAGNYEALFSKRARLYKERDLKNQNLSEEGYKKLILDHYTFLKRPVIIIDDKIFVGNSKKVVEQASIAING
ncbi:arsenate reductase family protein [Aquimarina sp. AU58]|uniref:arsenate reductase family protein n=1 Tax=Aquimarina sp. AU58 TaxID=1874112 RepID=UPI000D6E92B6|nr:ArsC/Spx/MgsR family protein [Aquimarina sp. AU58]